MTTPPLLEVRDLQISFSQYETGLRRRTVTPVRRMSLTVHAGEVVALVGASGAGKSLLAHAVLGLVPPNAQESGQVLLHGQPVTLQERARLAGRDLGLLPQSLTHLDPTATVGTQLRRAARLIGCGRRGSRDRARLALMAQGLDETVLRRYPHQLSGGMGRKVLTALSLMGDPALVVVDEPTPGLAEESVRAVLARLRDLADEGRGVLLVTHELLAACDVADRVVVADQGLTIDEQPVAAFSGAGEGLSHPYTRALWQALPGHGFVVPEHVGPPLEAVAPC